MVAQNGGGNGSGGGGGGTRSGRSPEVVHAEAVVKEIARAPPGEKRRLAVDQRLLLNEVQLLLADKRTAFALLRTGLTVSLVPLSLWTVLVATHTLWNLATVWWLLVPIMLVAVSLFALGAYLMVHALSHLRHTERVIYGLRRSDTLLEELMLEEPQRHFLLGRLNR